MSITLKKFLSLFALLAVFSVPVAVGVTTGTTGVMDAQAQWQKDRDIGTAQLEDTSVYTIIKTVMQWMLLILTVVAVIGFIISGLYFILGGGSGQAETAKSWLTYSIVGIIIALIGYIAINLIDAMLKGNVQT
ncbi:MAG: hypothetical protein U5L10_05425 [Candidatus Moranbacteria bacterium]|nr:hypothetical protein [Candidatus Moranbacteria bacterium]